MLLGGGGEGVLAAGRRLLAAVGYAGGHTPNPTYEEVCSARTGHTEVVLVVFDPAQNLLRRPAQGVLGGARPHPGMRQGNDVGTQYRSAVYYATDEQKVAAEASRERTRLG